MAIIRKGDSLPTQATANNGYVISGGRGRIKIGPNTFINLSDFPFDKVTGGLHLHSANLGGNSFEVLGSAFVDLEAGTSAALHRLHVGAGAVVDKELLGGKGIITLSETGHQDLSVELGTLQGTIDADTTISYTNQGSSIFFYVE